MIPLHSNEIQAAINPAAHGDVDVYELITITARLRDLLVRETAHLKAMEIQEIAKLQEEKQKLTKLMDAYQKLIQKRPELVRMLDADSRAELTELAAEFSRALAENMQRTAVARAVNQRVVQAIREVVTESNHAGTYNKYGTTLAPSNMAISFNLNQRA